MIIGDQLTAVYVDAADMVYAGCGGNYPGLSIYSGASWWNFTYSTSNLPYGSVSGITSGAGNDKWIAVFAGGLCKLDISTLQSGSSVLNENSISVFPNPAQDVLNVTLPLSAGEMNYQILDVTGKIILSQIIPNQSHFGLNLPETLEAGMYTLIIQNDVSVSTARFIKQ